MCHIVSNMRAASMKRSRWHYTCFRLHWCKRAVYSISQSHTRSDETPNETPLLPHSSTTRESATHPWHRATAFETNSPSFQTDTTTWQAGPLTVHNLLRQGKKTKQGQDKQRSRSRRQVTESGSLRPTSTHPCWHPPNTQQHPHRVQKRPHRPRPTNIQQHTVWQTNPDIPQCPFLSPATPTMIPLLSVNGKIKKNVFLLGS